MGRRIASVVIIGLIASYTAAQHRSAPNGYYPIGFGGDTFTGIITAVNADTREITLTYAKGEKSETFVGVLRPAYTVKLQDGTSYEVKMADFRVGDQMLAYYMHKEKKVVGKKLKYDEIFRFELSKPAKAS